MTNLELYGTNDVPPIPREVSNARIELLQEHLKQIATDTSKSYEVTRILKAIDFWNGLSEGEERHG